MKKNMGTIDKVTRILVAALLAVLFFMDIITGTIGIIVLIVAAIFLLTGIIGFCPLYTLFGIKTCKTKTQDK